MREKLKGKSSQIPTVLTRSSFEYKYIHFLRPSNFYDVPVLRHDFSTRFGRRQLFQANTLTKVRVIQHFAFTCRSLTIIVLETQ